MPRSESSSRVTLGTMMGYPSWFHHHGTKVQVAEFSQERSSLTLSGSAADLTIKPLPSAGPGYWRVVYSIRHGLYSRSKGTFSINTLSLLAMFGLTNPETHSHSKWLLKDFDADYASQGECIRKGNALNIPGPGTGHDGDPNISIELDDSIKTAIKELVG